LTRQTLDDELHSGVQLIDIHYFSVTMTTRFRSSKHRSIGGITKQASVNAASAIRRGGRHERFDGNDNDDDNDDDDDINEESIESKDDEEELEDEESIWRQNKALKMTKPALIDECIKLRLIVKKAEEARQNEERNRVTVQNDYEMLNRKVVTLERHIAEQRERAESSSSLESSGSIEATFGVVEARQVVAMAQEFTEVQRLQLGKFIRDKVFRKYKVTNKNSFANGDIQRMCHDQLDRGMREEKALAAYHDALIKLVQTELCQKRNKVNVKLLEKWAGEKLVMP
jgi:hypothetical protein